MTDLDVNVISQYAARAMSCMGAEGAGWASYNAVKWDDDRSSAAVPVPDDVDPVRLCDMLAQLLGRAGYVQWDVWIDNLSPHVVMVSEKEEDVE